MKAFNACASTHKKARGIMRFVVCPSTLPNGPSILLRTGRREGWGSPTRGGHGKERGRVRGLTCVGHMLMTARARDKLVPDGGGREGLFAAHL
jgi:hypothetical protein